jgi:hypothetical protein
MTTDNLLMTKIDPATERRRALAKVYSLLIRLAEQAEKKPTDQELMGEKKAEESTSMQVAPLIDDVESASSQDNIPP